MTRPASGWSWHFIGWPTSGIGLLNSSPGSLGIDLKAYRLVQSNIKIQNQPDIRRQLTESTVWQKITIHPSLPIVL